MSHHSKLKRRTIDWFRARGCIVGDTESWIPNTMITRDLYGFIDAVAIFEDVTIGLQACADPGGNGRLGHVRKIAAHPDFPRVARAWCVLIVAWRNVAPKWADPVLRPRLVQVVPKNGPWIRLPKLLDPSSPVG